MLHVAVEKNIVLTLAQVGLSRPAILLFVPWQSMQRDTLSWSPRNSTVTGTPTPVCVLLDRNIITVGTKRFRCVEVLIQPRFQLSDRNMFDVGVKRFRYAGSVVPARPSASGIQHGMRRLRPQEFVHHHRVVKWHVYVPGGFVSV